MKVQKRNGKLENIDISKIERRILSQLKNEPIHINIEELVSKVSSGLCTNIKTSEIDEFTAQMCASLTSVHPQYQTLASRICISNLHKQTFNTFSEKIEFLYKNDINISKDFLDLTLKYKPKIDEIINYERDYLINYFGYKTLEKTYLLKTDRLVERPQDLFMRVALQIHSDDIESAFETYNFMSQKYFIHATPTLFNAGTTRPQMSSCYLLSMQSDSIEGIFNTVKQCALISKNAGGLGMHIHKIRSKDSRIKGTGGTSNGIVPMLKVFDSTAKYVDQGGNKRPGTLAIYLEPWHADIFAFLDLRKNTGKDEHRTRDLFLGLWIPDLFMKRVKNDEQWSLFCPNDVLGLEDVYGDEFEKIYCKFEEEGRAKEKIHAQVLWRAIIEAQIETGNPYMLYKDTINKRSNQKNVGIIKCSNLCTEIVEYTSEDEIAVCNLASIALPSFIVNGAFDFELLIKITKIIVKNLNKIIDKNYYPVEEARTSNLRHRPIGIGVQGLADTFAILRYPFESEEARELNKKIFETIYFAALTSSCEISEKEGHYPSYEGSPISQGILQFDFWNIKPTNWDWDSLRNKISKFGVRNSLLIAPMPTASTSQILGFNECFEPFTSNIYTRRTLAGEFQVVNSYLLKDLIDLNLWNYEMKNSLLQNEGSVQNLPIPENLKKLYKIVWEIKMKTVLTMAIERSPFIDQSQSLNLFIPMATYGKLTSMHFFGWENGLKTGMYYLRTKPISSATKFTVDEEMINESKQSCKIGEPCDSCGS
ncbi:ribonucleoside-diphosphate reductase [Hamiltosporidium tvaerminnensis]|uniref:Ribonucleoside-diphosphate reductase n=2 Tax=Hamiltosporidium TaxID=1176354 RepID=A0A4Q9L5R2_9MICR|nr:hypothetical protein LUQ84_000331 [Hamiltosporidium tvaerminnensis]TBU02938.1 ribonucleoside-diphosphate reductase [Hamiltosporidium magnivora]TBU04253.1 ribonucleoside-diphosphate reductase [Hamiltosporidium tvaerminnensis]TBU08801.1 ribonucleoside-diphosphate reductase [Hamiltosporidium magnivora]